MSTTPADTASAAPDTASAPRRKMPRFLLPVVAALLLAALIAVIYWWLVGRFIQSTDDAYLAVDSVTIAPKVSGYVTDVYVGDNVEVKAGQPVVRLDSRQYNASLSQSRATIDARQADILAAQAQMQQQQAAIEQAQAQLAVAQVNLNHTEDEVRRYTPLASTGAESGDQLSELVSTRDQARATFSADKAGLDQAKAKAPDIKAQLAQAQAQLESAQAQAQQSQLDVGDTVIRSALAGRVGDRTVRVGQYAQPGTRLMTIVPVQSVYLTANFKETQIGHMHPGQKATIHVDAYADDDLHGTVESFAPGTGSEFALLPPENATGNFTKIVQRVPVRIHIDADEKTRARLLPGLSVTVDVDTRTGNDQHHAENDHDG